MDQNPIKAKKEYVNANKSAFVLFIAICADIVIVQGILAICMGVIIALFEITYTFYLNMALNACIQVVFVTVALIFLRKKRLLFSPIPKDKSAGRVNSILLNSLIGILCVCVSLLCFIGIASLFSVFLEKIGYYMPGGDFYFDTAGEMITVFLLVVVLAPICEEFLFRGILLSGMVKSGYSKRICVFCSGLIFSLMHMNPEQTVYQFMLGCAMAYMTLQSNSLLPATVMHAANNLFALLLDIFPTNPFVVHIFPATVTIIAIPLAVAGAVAIFYLCKLSGKIADKYNGESDRYKFEPDIAVNQPAVGTPPYMYNGGFVYNAYGNSGQPYWTGNMPRPQQPLGQFSGGTNEFSPQQPLGQFSGGTNGVSPQQPLGQFSGGTNGVSPQQPLGQFSGGTNGVSPQQPTGQFSGGTNGVSPQQPLGQFSGGTNGVSPQQPLGQFSGGTNGVSPQQPLGQPYSAGSMPFSNPQPYYPQQGYYANGYYQNPYVMPLYKRPDVAGNKKFSLFYLLSVATCACMWGMVFLAGMIGAL